MTTPSKVLLPIFVILGLALGGLLILKSTLQKSTKSAGTQEGHAEIAVGNTLPDFKLYPLGKAEPVLASSLPAKIMIINFWASWCEACMVEMPSIVKLRETYQSKGVEVLGINVEENPETVVPKVIQKMGIRFPIFVDPKGMLSELFDVHAIPLTVIIDHKRTILYIESGERDWNGSEVRDMLERWLAG